MPNKLEDGWYWVKLNPKSIHLFLDNQEWWCVYVESSEFRGRDYDIYVPGFEYAIDETYVLEWNEKIEKKAV